MHLSCCRHSSASTSHHILASAIVQPASAFPQETDQDSRTGAEACSKCYWRRTCADKLSLAVVFSVCCWLLDQGQRNTIKRINTQQTSLWVASCLLRSMRCDNHEDISAGTYALALFSKGRNVPVTLPSNTVCQDAEFHSSGSIQLSRLTIRIPGSLGTYAEKANPGQHMHGTSLYVEAATRLPLLLQVPFLGPARWVTSEGF